MSPMMLSSEGYQHVVVSGTPYERGYMHGAQAGDKVRFNVERYKTALKLPPLEICSRYIHEYYLPAIESQYPEGLEEMKGLAAGAEVSLADIVLCNARYDLSRVQLHAQTLGEDAGECTSMALIHEPSDDEEKNSVYIAQNWDISSWLYEADTIIILQIQNDSADDITSPKQIICLTEAGQLGRSGMNSLGLALCANSLWSSEDSSPLDRSSTHKGGKQNYLPFSLARRMFLECGNFSAGLQTLATFTRHVSGNVVVGSSSGLTINLEITPSEIFKSIPKSISSPQYSDTRLLTHANSFAAPAMLARPDIRDTYLGGSSFFRDSRLFSVLERKARQLKGSGFLGVKDLKAAFGDHAGFPRSLCEHKKTGEKYGASKGDSVTVASVIYDLERREMHICKGNPCCGTWMVYRLD